MANVNYEYYRRREQDERASAARAQDPTARCAHLDMAERYAERLRAMTPPVSAGNPG